MKLNFADALYLVSLPDVPSEYPWNEQLELEMEAEEAGAKPVPYPTAQAGVEAFTARLAYLHQQLAYVQKHEGDEPAIIRRIRAATQRLADFTQQLKERN